VPAEDLAALLLVKSANLLEDLMEPLPTVAHAVAEGR
jgi:hypothetical protein